VQCSIDSRDGVPTWWSVFLFQGVDHLEVHGQGDLVRQTAAGTVRWQKPGIDPEVNGGRQALVGGSVRKDGDHLGFQVAVYDTGRPFVIDPMLRYATDLGASGEGPEWGHAIAVATAGHATVSGVTVSPDGPTTPRLSRRRSGGATMSSSRICMPMAAGWCTPPISAPVTITRATASPWTPGPTPVPW
jgi:hypothetical protein